MNQTQQIVALASDGEPRASTEVIAKGYGVQHKNVLALIERYAEELRGFGVIAFEKRFNRRGRPTSFAMLNEQQAALLLTFMRNTDDVVGFKVRLVAEFFRMRESLARRDVGNMKLYFEAELKDKASLARASFGSLLMLERKREKPELKAELAKRLADAQPGLFLN